MMSETGPVWLGVRGPTGRIFCGPIGNLRHRQYNPHDTVWRCASLHIKPSQPPHPPFTPPPDVTAVCILEAFQNQQSMLLADKVLKLLGKEKAKEKYKVEPPHLSL